MVVAVAPELPFPVGLWRPPPGFPATEDAADDAHAVLPAVAVVEGGVEQAVPDAGGPDVTAHPGMVLIGTRELPTGSEKNVNKTINKVPQIIDKIALRL